MTLREIQQLRNAARRARRGQEPDAMRPSDWRRLKRAFGRRCAYCCIRPSRLTRDHVVPVARGGTSRLANIVPSCHGCNHSKGNLLLWRQWIPANPHPELLTRAPRPTGCCGYPGSVRMEVTDARA